MNEVNLSNLAQPEIHPKLIISIQAYRSNMGKFYENLIFINQILTLIPSGELTYDQMDQLCHLSTEMDLRWAECGLMTLPLTVMSQFPWRQLTRAPQVFLMAVTSKDSTMDQLMSELIKAYGEDTQLGPKIRQAWAHLRPLFQSKMSRQRFANLMRDLHDSKSGLRWEYINRLELVRRWFEHHHFDDLTCLDGVRYIVQMIDAWNVQGTLQFVQYHDDPDYPWIISTILHVNGVWKDPRVFHEVYEIAQSVSTGDLPIDRAIDSTLQVIYLIGRQTYWRIRSNFKKRLLARKRPPESPRLITSGPWIHEKTIRPSMPQIAI
jgi:hypothetical protein